MTESNKTFAFLAAAIVSLGGAYFASTAPSEFDAGEKVGQRLNEFEVDQPKSLKIIKVDAAGSKLDEFEVAEQGGVWTIPSKQGYPADATEQMAAAATGLINREILRVQSTTADEHEALGVLNPSDADLKGKAEGYGTRVVMNDAEDKPLVDMIIGNPVKDAEGQFYVRNTKQDVVYVVSVEPDKLATDFNQWIEDDLLKLDPFNITKVFINDYSAEMSLALTREGRLQPRISWDRRAEMRLAYDNKDAKWQPLELATYSKETGDKQERKLAADEELNEDALRELRNGLDDLLIVDVEKKPTGLSSDLKAGDDFLKNRENAESLAERGFAPVRIEEGGPMEILSSEGEVVCTLKNGVEYVLRFGKLAMDSEVEGAAAAKDAGGKLNRYLFVSARFNEGAVERPELKEVPPLPEGAKDDAAEDKAAASTPAEEASADGPAASADKSTPAEDKATDDKATDEKTEEEEEEEEAADDAADAKAADAKPAADDSAPAADGAEKQDASAANEASAAEDKPAGEAAEKGAEEAPKADDKSPADAGNADKDAAAARPAEDPAKELEAVIAERKSIQAENDRLLDEYKDTLKEGRENVEELNERFGDWYYVISEDVYKQIHLGIDQVIKKKAAEKPADGAAGAKPDDDPTAGLPNLPIGGAPPSK